MDQELTFVERQIILLTKNYNYHQSLFFVFCLKSSHELIVMHMHKVNLHALSFAVSNS